MACPNDHNDESSNSLRAGSFLTNRITMYLNYSGRDRVMELLVYGAA
jgi:hypothetical protein